MNVDAVCLFVCLPKRVVKFKLFSSCCCCVVADAVAVLLLLQLLQLLLQLAVRSLVAC